MYARMCHIARGVISSPWLLLYSHTCYFGFISLLMQFLSPLPPSLPPSLLGLPPSLSSSVTLFRASASVSLSVEGNISLMFPYLVGDSYAISLKASSQCDAGHSVVSIRFSTRRKRHWNRTRVYSSIALHSVRNA